MGASAPVVIPASLSGHDISRSYAPRAKCLGTLGFARKVRMASRTIDFFVSFPPSTFDTPTAKTLARSPGYDLAGSKSSSPGVCRPSSTPKRYRNWLAFVRHDPMQAAPSAPTSSRPWPTRPIPHKNAENLGGGLSRMAGRPCDRPGCGQRS